MVDIKGLDKANVLLALWNASRCHLPNYDSRIPLTVEEADEEIKKRTHNGMCWFDQFNGIVIKVDIGGDEFDERYFDEINGEGQAQMAIDSVEY